MPYSDTAGKKFSKDFFDYLNPKTVLDIGVGCGTYSKLMRDSTKQHWTGIEVWEPYVNQFNLRDMYDTLILEDVRLWNPVGQYNIAFVGDILEHMTIQESKDVLNKIRKICDYTVISIPLGRNPQGEFEGNPYEIHVEEYWDDNKVRTNFGTPIMSNIEKGHWVTIGAYIYPKIF